MPQLFRSPKTPDAPVIPAPPPPAPTIDQAALNQDQSDRLRRRRGAASTILVPDQSMMPTAGGLSSILG